MRTIFETCKPRADVQAGTTKDEQFAARLAKLPPEVLAALSALFSDQPGKR